MTNRDMERERERREWEQNELQDLEELQAKHARIDERLEVSSDSPAELSMMRHSMHRARSSPLTLLSAVSNIAFHSRPKVSPLHYLFPRDLSRRMEAEVTECSGIYVMSRLLTEYKRRQGKQGKRQRSGKDRKASRQSRTVSA